MSERTTSAVPMAEKKSAREGISSCEGDEMLSKLEEGLQPVEGSETSVEICSPRDELGPKALLVAGFF